MPGRHLMELTESGSPNVGHLGNLTGHKVDLEMRHIFVWKPEGLFSHGFHVWFFNAKEYEGGL